MSSIYTEKYVLFLDILGFEAYVDDERKSEEFARKVLPLLDKLVRQNTQYTKKKNNSSQQYSLLDDAELGEISQFSDTFVISSQSFNILKNNAIHIQNTLLKKNILSRGAITRGKIFHSGSQFIGPAINRAYNLEKSEAIYPRVIIDPLCEQHPSVRSAFNATTYSESIVKDYDGYLYINYFTQFKKFANIENLYEEHKNTKHRGKYTWLKQKTDEVKEARKKQEDLKKYKHTETYDILPFQDEIF